MSFEIVMENLKVDETRFVRKRGKIVEVIRPEYFDYTKILSTIFIAWNDLAIAHQEGFILYRVIDGVYTIDASHYGDAVKRWEKKRDDLQKFSSQTIVLDKLPRSPQKIGVELSAVLSQIKDITPQRMKHIYKALDYGNSPKHEFYDKIADEVGGFFSNIQDK